MNNLTADHGAMCLGRGPVVAADYARALRLADFVDEVLPEPPPLVDYLRPMSSIDMLANDRYGNCMPVAIMHLAQSITAVMGRERKFTAAEALDAYSALTGFQINDPSTDRGTNMFYAVQQWKQEPGIFGGIEIEGFVSIDITDWRKVQQGMWLLGGLLLGFDLPRITKHQVRWRLEMGQGDDMIQPGGWGGHAVHAGRRTYGHGILPDMGVTTWGADTDVESSFVDCGYGAECIGVLVKGWEPPNVPGFDRDRLLRAMRELGR